MNQDQIQKKYQELCMQLGDVEVHYRLNKNKLIEEIVKLDQLSKSLLAMTPQEAAPPAPPPAPETSGDNQ